MSDTAPALPRLPRELYTPSLVGGASFIGYAVGLFVVPAWLAVELVSSPVALALRIPGVLALLLVAQQGVHLLGWVGHEGFHFNLHRNRYVSALLGIFFSSMVLSFFQVGVGPTHWVHHRYTNRPEDPDWRIFSRYQTLGRRLLLGRAQANRVFLRNLLKVALGRELDFPHVVPFRPAELRALAWVNIACSLLWLSVYVAITVRSPLAGLVGILLPHVLGFFFSGPRPYVEHAGTGVGQGRDARTCSSKFMTVLFMGNNFHLEHHLYPAIPCYRLPSVHRYLTEQGFFEREGIPIETTVRGAYAHASGRSRYPSYV
ncbi:fatty acid desaturase [Archangium violaceum]|uniref:fatty acid desaturase family protein n=1 Tax=Archangium violaceum TaxID=83451 RepID=UPI00195218EB|nr:fatty acid desaturase [Archangium violaceum]QRN94336.1 fatty acid desaturase [Archangium violaceum]